MEDKELKKRLQEIPNVDENGDPIYKIDNESKKPFEKVNERIPPAAPLFMSHILGAPQGNLQDEKDKTKE